MTALPDACPGCMSDGLLLVLGAVLTNIPLPLPLLCRTQVNELMLVFVCHVAGAMVVVEVASRAAQDAHSPQQCFCSAEGVAVVGALCSSLDG